MPRRSKPQRWSLYWCATPDGDEDWFVVATSAKNAARFHEASEGYARGSASAQRVAPLPASLVTDAGWRNGPTNELRTRADWPVDEVLVACGGEIASSPPSDEDDELRRYLGVNLKDVRFGDKAFRSGDVVENVARDQGSKGARLSVFRGGKGS